MVGQRLGHYLIAEQIGAGGMGIVYRARDERLDRDVAVKVLPAGSVSDETARKRLRKEALALSRLNHPNIETVYDFDTQQNIDFLVAELIPGVSLDHKLAAGPLPEKEIGRLGTQMAQGLEAAHEGGIVHHDLKPANLRQTPDGRLKIVDFGLAQDFASPGNASTTTSQRSDAGISGTLPYIAPEHLQGEKVGPRGDIYSAGTVLYEMATGRTPFQEKSSPLLMEAILNRPPVSPTAVNPRITPALEAVIMKAMDKDPDRRYQSARELRVDLERLSGATLPSIRPMPRKKKVWTAGILAALVATLLATGYRLHFFGNKPASSDRITLAVLPFEVLTNEEDVGFLRVGIADSVITKLASFGRLRLRPTSAILRYEKQQADPRQAGQALAADYVATGTVQKTGDRFRISTQLVRISDGASVWGEHYDLARSDLLGLEDTIAGKIATALRVEISAAERERLYRRYTANPAAYELYLKGRAEVARLTRESTLAAVDAFESALHQDPNYALAHAGLAMSCALMRLRYASEGQVANWEERAHQEAQRALQLDANLAEAHEALAAVYRSAEFDWARVIEESRRALDLNRSLEMPHYYLAVAFYHLGLFDMVEPEVRAGLEINPANRAEALRVRGSTALFSGRFQEAERHLRELRQLSSSQVSDWYLAQAMFYDGQAGRAEEVLAALHGSAQAERRAQATLASFLAARHESEQARKLLQSVAAGSYLDHHVAYGMGVAYTQLGDFAEAHRWLNRSTQTGFPCYPWFVQDPLLKPLREDPSSQTFLNQLRDAWDANKKRYGLSPK
jgi:eukaryotic-like serine/threonine-protein kinase